MHNRLSILVGIGFILIAGISGCLITKPLPPLIERIVPPEAPIGAEISIIGSGFTPTRNSLQFGSGFAYINHLLSADGKTLTFTLPESFDTCNPGGSVCAGLLSQPIPGTTYDITVVNANGRSNSARFTVIAQEVIALREGQRDGPFLLEKIYPDHVTGLNFREYPVALERGFPVTLRIGGKVTNGCTITLMLIRIEKDTATFKKWIEPQRPCPICLAENALIDTPSGAMPVEKLKEGMAIWSVNRAGERVPEIVVKTSKTLVPSTHQVIDLILDDGREVLVSPGHPTIDGRRVGDLKPGELYNGSYVVSTEVIPYNKKATYDILPSGETGFYWADGVLLGSTLR